jgi:hypothetical protein
MRVAGEGVGTQSVFRSPGAIIYPAGGLAAALADEKRLLDTRRCRRRSATGRKEGEQDGEESNHEVGQAEEGRRRRCGVVRGP